MKQMLLAPTFALALALALPLTVAPALAQQAPSSNEPSQSWWDWGMSIFGDSLGQDMAPAIADIREFTEQLGPAMAPAIEKLLTIVDDMTNYALPEMLENGDIIIRRKPDAPLVEDPLDPGTEL